MIVLALALAGSFLGANPPGPVDSTRPPSNADGPIDARDAGLKGLVYDQGRWVSPDEVVVRDLQDSRLAGLRAEYADRRAQTPMTARAQRDLARWCDRAGLKAESLAHFMVVARLDPEDLEARRRLGLRFQGGMLKSEVEIAAEAIEAEAQAKADRSWGPKIATWRKWLLDPAHKSEAIKALGEVRDPRAIPSVRRSFGDGDASEQGWAVKLLGGIDAPRSSQILAGLAVFGLDGLVRLKATEKLAGRDPRPFVGLLINWLHEPIRFEVVDEAAAGLLRVEGTSAIIERFYSPTLNAGRATRPAGTMFGPDASGAINQGMIRAVRERRREDVLAIERANYAIERTNARVERTLQVVTGVDLGKDPVTWTSWWTGELGYSYESPKPPTPKPVIQEEVGVAYSPPPANFGTAVHHSCFGAGTPVMTRTGARPIEDLRVGDQVLAQSPSDGELYFRPILAVFHNKPTATLRVEFEGETIVATGIHRFWKSGQGWAMARDLRPGDRVRTLGGDAEVKAVDRDDVRPVFNLEVADGHSFFVGTRRALVHDNSLVAPTPEPFDARAVAANSTVR